MSETSSTPAPGTEQPAETPAEGAVSSVIPPEPKRPEWADRRLANITAQRREAEERASRFERESSDQRARLDALLRTLPDDHPARQQPQMSAEDLSRQAEARGAERARTEERDRVEMDRFVSGCNSLAEKVQKEFGDEGFKAAAGGWHRAGLDLPNPQTRHAGSKTHRELVSLIMDQDDGARIFENIGRDPDFAAYLLDPSTPPMQAAYAIARRLPTAQARELVADAAAQADSAVAPGAPPVAVAPVAASVRPVSSAPRPPAQPVASRGSSGGSRDISDPKISMDEYARTRAEQRKAARPH